MKRREFMVLLSVAATWSMPALAQHGERMRRIDVLMNFAADDPESQARLGLNLPATVLARADEVNSL